MSDPAEKYRGRVDPDHELAMQAIGFTNMALRTYRAHYEALLKAQRDLDSMGIVLDPTLYRDVIHSRSLAQQIKLVEAALAFLRAADAVLQEVSGEASR